MTSCVPLRKGGTAPRVALVTVETGCNGLEAELLVLLSDAGILQEWGNARPLVL